METKQVAKILTETKNIQLVDGKFTPTEASDMITSLINEKINFHKIQRLKIWEGDHHRKTNLLDSRIDELVEEKKIAKKIVAEARSQGKNLSINGIFKYRSKIDSFFSTFKKFNKNSFSMELSKKNTTTLLGLLLLLGFIALSYLEGSLFLDKILLCSFILVVVLLANLQSGVRRNITGKKQDNG